jgi:hypothetical protein
MMDYTPNTISAANQIINDLRQKVDSMETEIALLKRMITEETAMRYDLYQRLASTKSHSDISL